MKVNCLFFIFLFCTSTLFAQTIRYEFAAPNAVHHEAEISLTADKLPAGPAYFMMSRSSPGRYAKHEFGKNVYNVKATDANGNNLPVEKTDADVYKVTSHKGTVKVTYTLYANYTDGTYSSVDRTGFHLNIPATFMWVKGLDKAPIYLHLSMPDSTWKVATQLKPEEKSNSFFAPGLQYFMDSPIKAGDLQFKEWTVTNPDNKQYLFRIALEANAPVGLFNQFANKVQRMVQEAQAIFGEVPAYDYGTYTFIASINPYVKGDGMEHRNSTMITLPRNFDGSNSLLGVFSHEFFHCWNVERIRPVDLEPFNFEKSNMSQGLWVAEGFTQYYGDLILKRAGLMDETEFLDEMSGLINVKVNSPGARNYSPIENSQRAVFVDAGVSIDKNNYPNMYSSYYTYGGATALALDLELRKNFKNTTLDDFMRLLWVKFGKKGIPYTVKDLQAALAAITNAQHAATFFNQFVYGHKPFNYGEVLAPAGLQLKVSAQDKAWPGKVNFIPASGYLVVGSNTIQGSPLYKSGIDVDDIILSVDGKNVISRSDFYKILEVHKPGDSVPISYKHRGETIDTTLVLGFDPSLEVKPMDDVSTVQRNNRLAWLASKISS